jgi:hypothetical protein
MPRLTRRSRAQRWLSPAEGQSETDGTFAIDSVPVVTQQVAASKPGYVTQTADVEIEGVATATLALEQVRDTEAMGPDGEIVFTSEATGTLRRYRARVGGVTGRHQLRFGHSGLRRWAAARDDGSDTPAGRVARPPRPVRTGRAQPGLSRL